MTRLHLYDVSDKIPIYVNILGGPPGHILVGIVPEHFGDIEVAFQVEDCKQIAILLERTLKDQPDHVNSSAHGTLSYHFKNLDGGEDAAFLVSPTADCVAITVRRSDEGDLSFRISVKDAAHLLDALKDACK